MKTIAVHATKNRQSGGRSIYYSWQNSKKRNFERNLGGYDIRYCVRRGVELIKRDCGTIYSLYRSSVFISYDCWYLNLYFCDKEVIFSGKSVRVRRVFLPCTFDMNSLRKVAFSRIQECLIKNRPEGMGYYFITLPRDVDIRDFLSRYFYKSSSYRYVCFKEHGSVKGGIYFHNHYLVILPEALKARLPGDDRRLIYIDSSDLPRVINYGLKNIKQKSVNVSRAMCLPKLSRLNKSRLQSMLGFVFDKSPLSFFVNAYKNRLGEDCLRVGFKFSGGLEAREYKLRMKKKIN
jgi:hypothetical protein